MSSLEETYAALESRMGARRAQAAEQIFTVQKAAPTSKADITDAAAREIIDAETRKRRENTERLREARLAKERKAAK